MDEEAQARKEEIDKLGFMKIVKFCASKDIRINIIKRQHTEWEKVFANHISDKGLLSRIYKELLKLSTNKKPD